MLQPIFRPDLRQAAADFVRGTTFGWRREDLARWLVCQYSPCLAADATVAARATRSAAAERVEDAQIERVILTARCGVLRTLADLGWPTLARQVAKHAVAVGDVRKVRSPGDAPERDRGVWTPVGRERMRLVDRVASLFIADAMNHPKDYKQVLLCRHCGELGFSRPVVHASSCEGARSVA